MALHDDDSLITLKEAVLSGMREYLDEFEPNYAEADIRECGEILDKHLAAISEAMDRETATSAVRQTVMHLNDLNRRCGGELIETVEREDICSFIIRAGALRGFNGDDEDVTFEYREW